MCLEKSDKLPTVNDVSIIILLQLIMFFLVRYLGKGKVYFLG